MDLRNRLGLYGSYFLGMAGIGFTLPYLPLYLGERGMSDRMIGLLSTAAAITALGQFPIGRRSDRVGSRKPFLLAALGAVALATIALPMASGPIALGLAVLLFAENGLCRATLDSLAGAEAVALAKPAEVGSALGALRLWRPLGIMAVAIAVGWIAERYGVGAILPPLAVVQCLAFAAALLIHEAGREKGEASHLAAPSTHDPSGQSGWLPRDPTLLAFIGAMVLFHTANSPPGVYLGLYLKRTLHAPDRMLAIAFVVSMATWMLVTWPTGRLVDRWGRRPFLIAAWAIMSLRLALVAAAQQPWHVLACQVLDGLGSGLFAIAAASWVTDRMGGAARAAEAQAIVGTSLVLGSAVGPALCALLVGWVDYRGLFSLLAAIGLAATAIVVMRIPETLEDRGAGPAGDMGPDGALPTPAR